MSSLLLKKHFFSKIELRPNQESKPEGVNRIGCSLGIGKAVEDPQSYQLTLTIDIEQDPASTEKPHYTGSFEIVGFFAIAPSFKGDPDRLVQISGASLLYGAVREMVCNLTARGPWPILCLPTINFTPQPGESPVPVETMGATAAIEAPTPTPNKAKT